MDLKKLFGDKSLQKIVDEGLKEARVRAPMKSTEHLRASEIVDVCPREEALCARDHVTRKDVIPAKLARTFKFGRAFEKMFRDHLADVGILIGTWQCQCGFVSTCDDKGLVRHKRPTHCKSCAETGKFEYLEEFSLDRLANVGGHNDGFLHVNGEYIILELKTCSARAYKEFKERPKENHIGQVQIYMKIHGYKRAVIWYFNKDSSEQTLHWIDADPVVTAHLLEKGTQVRHYFETGKIPQRVCINAECPRAQKCAVRLACFGE